MPTPCPCEVQQRHVFSSEAESGMDQPQGQRRLARARTPAEEQDAVLSEECGRVDGKFIGAAIENLGHSVEQKGHPAGQAGYPLRGRYGR